MRPLVIGYYVHHHGRGHATRAGVIGAALTRRGHRVTYLGGGALPDGETVTLAHDADADDAPFVEATAGGRLHWAPLGGGYRTRAAQLADWVARARPDVVVIDVSVEVTVLVRALGVPVVVVAQPGVRDDASHELAYDLAAAILAPWPPGLDVAPHLARWRTTVACVGGISRFARDRPVVREHPSEDESISRTEPSRRPASESTPPQRAVLLVGGEGWDDPELPEQIMAALPQVTWRRPDARHPVQEVLADADVVVTHAGQNALADVACFGVPAVVVPQHRPFDEQADMARALDAAGVARSVPLGASGAQVADAVASARGEWDRWQVAGAPERACAVIERVVLRTTVVTPVRGRFEHLANQRRYLRATAPGVLHVVVSVGSDEDHVTVRSALAERGLDGDDLVVLGLDDDPLGMPTARARNHGVAEALRRGSGLVILLDVDCAPLPAMVERFEQAVRAHGDEAVLNGIVTYLSEDARLDDVAPTAAQALIAPHPVRPNPDAGQVVRDDAHHLLWSLAVAVTPEVWRRTGEFDEAYVGYGAEDTDFGMRARTAGLDMAWVGGAHALHQWHPSATPPVHHLDDIVRNSRLYRERWGVWPMEGWLRAFAEGGLIEWTEYELRVRPRDTPGRAEPR